MIKALIVTDHQEGVKAVVIADGLVLTGAGSGTLAEFASWAETSGLSLDGVKSSISDPSLRILGPIPATSLVLDQFQSLMGVHHVSTASKAAAYHDRINSAIELRMNDNDLKVLGLRAIGRRGRGGVRSALREARFDPDSFDADGDGKLQDGTAFERPAGRARRAVDRVVSAADRFERHQQGQFTDSLAQQRARRRRVGDRVDGVYRRIADRLVGGESVSDRLESARRSIRRSPSPAPAERPGRLDAVLRRFADALAGPDEQRDGDAELPSIANIGRSGVGITDYGDGLKHVYQDGGSIEDIADETILTVLLDENLTGGLTKEDILLWNSQATRLVEGNSFENDRYTFEVVKADNGYQGPWHVFKVVDKTDGSTWFMKSSVYGNDDALLESVGMKAAEVLGMGNNESHLRVGQVIPNNGNRPFRWMMMRDAAEWDFDHQPVDGQRGKWNDWGKRLSVLYGGNPYEAEDVDIRDVARILLMDYVFDNEDRHSFNLLSRYDQKGRLRLGVIDNGLLFGGRLSSRAAALTPAQDYVDEAERRKTWDVEKYADRATNNPFSKAFRGMPLRITSGDGAERRRNRFQAQVDRSLAALEGQLDSILSAERIESRGMTLSSTERAHLDAMRQVAEARLAILRSNPVALLEQLMRVAGS